MNLIELTAWRTIS